jgi:hypothetical protein
VRDPRARRTRSREAGTLERGGTCSRVVGTLERGGPCSRAVGTLERGGPHSRGFEPSSEADLARGGALVGRGGRHGVDRVVFMFCVKPEVGFAFCVFCRF